MRPLSKGHLLPLLLRMVLQSLGTWHPTSVYMECGLQSDGPSKDDRLCLVALEVVEDMCS